MSRILGWVGVDLDGTLAHEVSDYQNRIGEPHALVVEYVRGLLVRGEDVRIFTARVDLSCGRDEVIQQRALIEGWCLRHFGRVLPITNVKTRSCKMLLDDRARQAWNGVIAPDVASGVDDHK